MLYFINLGADNYFTFMDGDDVFMDGDDVFPPSQKLSSLRNKKTISIKFVDIIDFRSLTQHMTYTKYIYQ